MSEFLDQLEPREGFVAVGLITRPWGLRGDVKVESLTDFPERFDPGAVLWADGAQYQVEQSRIQQGNLYLKLTGITSVDDAERLRGLLLEVPESDLHPLEEGDYYHYQLEGLAVQTIAGEPLGIIEDIFEPGAHSVLVVRGERGEILIPFIDDVIRRVDLAAREIEVELFDGLLPDPPPAKRARPARPRRRGEQAPPPA